MSRLAEEIRALRSIAEQLGPMPDDDEMAIIWAMQMQRRVLNPLKAIRTGPLDALIHGFTKAPTARRESNGKHKPFSRWMDEPFDESPDDAEDGMDVLFPGDEPDDGEDKFPWS